MDLDGPGVRLGHETTGHDSTPDIVLISACGLENPPCERIDEKMAERVHLELEDERRGEMISGHVESSSQAVL